MHPNVQVPTTFQAPILCSPTKRERVIDAVTIVFVTNDARFGGGNESDGEKHSDTTKKRKSK